VNNRCFPPGKSIVLDYTLLHNVEIVKWAKVAVCNNVQVLIHILVSEFLCDSHYDCRPE
jgi:hypothetical protein